MVDVMIRLFESTATVFSTNGLGVLPDAILCTVTEERNGEYELEMDYPITGKRYSDIELRRIIVAKPNPYSDSQPFRIYSISKPINGIVTINAEHISYDLSGYPVSQFSAYSANESFIKMEEACEIACLFSFSTDKTTSGRLYVPKPMSIRSILGGTDGSILDVYGGEYEFDNYSVKLWNNRGYNRGVSIRYGKNLTDLRQEENCNNLYTGVMPFWYSEEEGLLQPTEKIVNASGTYDFTRIYVLDLSSEFSEKPTRTELIKKAQEYIEKNNIGVPKVSLEVSFVELAQSEEYKNYALLERVHLCDTVNVEFPKLNVSATAKCIKTVYNVLTNKYDSVELGDAKSDLASTISLQSQNIIKKVNQTKTFLENAIDNATQLITGGLGGHVVIQSSTGDGYPDEILIMDTDNINTATKVWRWNKGGLGYSSTGYNGPYTTAITADGCIVADFISAGKFDGMLIKAGTIKAEALDIEYRKSVEKYVDDWGDMLAEEIDSNFSVHANEIKAEISRAQKAEKSLEDKLLSAEQNLTNFQNEVNTTFKDGIVTEAESNSISNYLNILKKDYETVLKEYNSILNTMRTSNAGSGSNLSISFNPDCETELSSSGTKYDYIQLYYIDTEGKVRLALEKASGADLAGKTFVIPGTEMYVYWYSDGSNCNYYGFSVDKIERTATDATISGTSSVSLPTAAQIIEAATASIITTNHPYTNNERKIWHYKSEQITKTVLNNYKTQYVNAYNNLLNFINQAINDNKISDTEKTKIDEYFTTYTATLATLKEALQNAGIDLSARTSASVLDYAKANFIITESNIKAEVTRAKGVEDELKASIQINADNITSCVTKNGIGSYITQYYNNVIVAFNNNSKYVQINAGEIAIYDNGISSGKKRATFNEQGNHFYRDGYYVGKIGTNQWNDYPTHKGLVFDLEYEGKYMAFAQRTSSSSSVYTTMLCFSRANSGYDEYGLHLGCDFYGHNFTLNGFNLTNCSANGYATFTGTLPVVTSIRDMGNGSISWSYGNVYIKNGMITSVPT